MYAPMPIDAEGDFGRALLAVCFGCGGIALGAFDLSDETRLPIPKRVRIVQGGTGVRCCTTLRLALGTRRSGSHARVAFGPRLSGMSLTSGARGTPGRQNGKVPREALDRRGRLL